MKKIKQSWKQKILILTLLLLAVTAGILAYAKYVSQDIEDNPGKAKQMHFVSDVLLEETDMALTAKSDYTLTNWQQGKKITFFLQNYPDSKRHTSTDITYQLAVAEDPQASFCVDGAPVVDPKNLLMDYEKEKTEHIKQEVGITLSENFMTEAETEKIATVTATTKKPYVKELSARFLIKKTDTGYKVTVEDEAQSPYAKVIIWAEEKLPLKLQWDETLVVPDQTNKFLKDKEIKAVAGTTKSVELGELDAISSATIYMMKYEEEEKYTVDQKAVIDVLESQPSSKKE